ncbi:response regulator [Streptomyces sp. NPDC059688]|uniref:Response regulator transcription factor n=2 Tax=Streptomyces TaxID=1883 RepID=A0ABY6EF44_9ACTN|nr:MULTISPECIES: response regulator transcription factor [unclassified Streptomyces]OKJ80937.1 LuxR family transcriptional regulator [Streptomyces sp. CB01883]ROP55742.1 LuxR family two component transcriptional regulator [Streptomyces sp. PanSC9]UXY33500.1 response regulator transcription factor [Streptomyces sp. HUAS 14-6]
MRVLLAEDLFLLRDGLTRTLREHGCEVVASVDNGPELRRALADTEWDVALIDIRLPPTHTDEGLKAALEARRTRPGLPVLILSQYVDQLYAHELLASGEGAVGYLLKDRVTHTAQFLDALRTVAAGGTVMDPQVIAKLLSRSEKRGRVHSLTAREHEVLARMAEGHSNAAIARTLHISESAVAKHIASLFGKLGLRPSPEANRRVLAVLAYLKG